MPGLRTKCTQRFPWERTSPTADPQAASALPLASPIHRATPVEAGQTEQILGIPFFTGDVRQAVQRMLPGGLLVVPAAPALRDLKTEVAYRSAMLGADLVIPDSAYMVLIWNLLRGGRRIHRLSGLEYLRELLTHATVRAPGNTLWIMAGERSALCNLAWLHRQGIHVPSTHVYHAPIYGHSVALVDDELRSLIENLQPAHIVVTLGGGTQERLGIYLRNALSYAPGIHCIGAAIAFLSGDQVKIPIWADKYYLGWLLRIFDEPTRYGPRYWAAKSLFALILRYRAELPPLTT